MEEHAVPNLNPRITAVEVGIRELRTIKIYPLSASQQMDTVEIVTTLINVIADQTETMTDEQLIEMFSTNIKEKMREILAFVTDPIDEVTFDEIDNVQLTSIIENILTVNFGDTLKKFQAIWGTVKDLFLSQKSSQKSSEKPVTS